MYSNPSARVLTGRIFSLFPVSRSSRQGCPLSPALFVLSLEPLPQAIRQSTVVSPVCIRNTQHQLSLFADDVMVFLENASQSLSHLLSLYKLTGHSLHYSI